MRQYKRYGKTTPLPATNFLFALFALTVAMMVAAMVGAMYQLDTLTVFLNALHRIGVA